MSSETAATTEIRRVTEAYFDAENRRDLEGILDHFHQDVRFFAPDGVLLEGHQAVREFYASNADGMPELTVELVCEVADGPRGAVQWLARGVSADGAEILMRGANVIHVEDGRFTEFHAYWGSRSPRAHTF